MNDLNGYDIEDLRVGMSATFSKSITEADIVLFAGASGDTTCSVKSVAFIDGEALVKFDSSTWRSAKAALGLRRNKSAVDASTCIN